MLNPGGDAAFLIVCDHAGRQTPVSLGRLGLPDAAFERHIAWDIGAAGVTERLAARVNACAVLQNFSRLVIDCNRRPDAADLIPLESDGTAIPGNADLSEAQRRARIEAIFEPYHREISDQLEARAGAGPVLVSIHSFTPTMGGIERPWGYGVLHADNSPVSKAMLALLAAEAPLPCGDNQPYAMDGTDYTVPHHAGGRGLDYLELEIRQDLIATEDGQGEVAALLARLIPQAVRGASSPG